MPHRQSTGTSSAGLSSACLSSVGLSSGGLSSVGPSSGGLISVDLSSVGLEYCRDSTEADVDAAHEACNGTPKHHAMPNCAAS